MPQHNSKNSPFSQDFTFKQGTEQQQASLFGIVGASGKVERLAAKFNKNSDLMRAVEEIKQTRLSTKNKRLDFQDTYHALSTIKGEDWYDIANDVMSNSQDELIKIGLAKMKNGPDTGSPDWEIMADSLEAYTMEKWLADKTGTEVDVLGQFDRTKTVLSDGKSGATLEELSSLGAKNGYDKEEVLQYKFSIKQNLDYDKDFFTVLKDFPVRGARSKEELLQYIADNAGTKTFNIDPDLADELFPRQFFRNEEERAQRQLKTVRRVPLKVLENTGDDPFVAVARLRRWFSKDLPSEDKYVKLYGNTKTVLEDPIGLDELMYVASNKGQKLPWTRDAIERKTFEFEQKLLDVRSKKELKEVFSQYFSNTYGQERADQIRNYVMENYPLLREQIQRNIHDDKQRIVNNSQIAVKVRATGEVFTGNLHFKIRQDNDLPGIDARNYVDGFYDPKTKTFYNREEFGQLIKDSKIFEDLIDAEGFPVLGYLEDVYDGTPVAESIRLKEAKVLKKIQDGKGPNKNVQKFHDNVMAQIDSAVKENKQLVSENKDKFTLENGTRLRNPKTGNVLIIKDRNVFKGRRGKKDSFVYRAEIRQPDGTVYETTLDVDKVKEQLNENKLEIFTGPDKTK